jgi:MFS family permease
LTQVVPLEPDRQVVTTSAQPLWTHNFRLYFAARSLSLIGDAMLPVALSIGVLFIGYGANGVGYSLGAWMAGLAVFTPFAGVLADRFTPRRMMLIAALARLLVQSTMAVAFAVGTPALWQIVVLQLASGLASALFQPGTASLIPQIAGDVQKANATLRIAEALLNLAGPVLAGVLVALAGPAVVFAVDASAFALTAAILLALRLAGRAAATSGSFRRDLVDGWQEFTSRRWLWTVIAIWTLYGLAVFGPALPLGASLIITDHGPTSYGVVMTAFGAGAAVGGVVGLRWKPRRPLAGGAIAMLGFAFFPLMPALGVPAFLVAAGYVIAGASLTFWGVMWSTTVQTHVPAAVLNRVYAYDVAGSLVVLALGRMLAGPIAHFAGERQFMLASTAISIGCCCLLLAVPAIRNLRGVTEPAG